MGPQIDSFIIAVKDRLLNDEGLSSRSKTACLTMKVVIAVEERLLNDVGYSRLGLNGFDD